MGEQGGAPGDGAAAFDDNAPGLAAQSLGNADQGGVILQRQRNAGQGVVFDRNHRSHGQQGSEYFHDYRISLDHGYPAGLLVAGRQPTAGLVDQGRPAAGDGGEGKSDQKKGNEKKQRRKTLPTGCPGCCCWHGYSLQKKTHHRGAKDTEKGMTSWLGSLRVSVVKNDNL
jgi:hypothetical protein